jgi:Flp pilus assembly protein TadD
VLFLSFCSAKVQKSELDFANDLAREGLWKEAYLRWQRVLDSGKETAAIHNNMAIALEQMGKRDEAGKEYKKALELAPNSARIKTNYERFKDFGSDKQEKEKKKKKGKGEKEK